MPRGETSNVADGLENVVAAETVLSKVDGEAGRADPARPLSAGHRRSPQLRVADRCAVAGFRRSSARRRSVCAVTWARHANVRSRSMRELLPIAGRLPPLAAVRLLLASVPDDADDAPLLLTATVAVGLAAVIRIRDGKTPVAPDPHSGHAADFLRMLKGTRADCRTRPPHSTPIWSRAADHGLNASTFTARVAASTRASLTDAVTAALCALKGPLHGGAPGPVLDMLDAIGPAENAEAWLDAAVMRGDRLMGFGHRVYRVQDPRSDVVKAVVSRLNRDIGRLRYAEAVEQAALAVLTNAQAEPLAADQSRVLHRAAAGGSRHSARRVHRRLRGRTRGRVDRARAGAAGGRATDPATVGLHRPTAARGMTPLSTYLLILPPLAGWG